MIKHLCTGIVVAACLSSVCGAADLSVTPIYKSRPSAGAAPDGSLKAEYRTFSFGNSRRSDRSAAAHAIAGVIAMPSEPANDRAPQSGGRGRF